MQDDSKVGLTNTQCYPRLQPNIERCQVSLRGEQWVILQNTVNGLHVRLNEQASQLLDKMDGSRSLSELVEHDDAAGITQQELEQLLKTLCASDMLDLRAETDASRLTQQKKHLASLSVKQKWLSPLAIKFALHNPDRWLDSVTDKLGFLFSKYTLWLYLALLLVATTLLLIHFDDVTEQFKLLAQQPRQWWFFGAMYPLLKLVHEFAHAVCIKRWGGSVHETGITFLVLMPVPYVNASDSWLFEKKYQRIIVTAAGIMAETSLACIGLILWLTVEPGLVSNLSFALFMLGSLSTVLFNANPLLRFDGYYLLQDYLEIPNLGSRANSYYRYLGRRFLLRVKPITAPKLAIGERKWLLIYGALAYLYRVFITLVIALYLAGKFLFAGVLLASFALFQMFVKPIFSLVRYIQTSEDFYERRVPVGLAALCVALVVFGLLSALPLPSSTRTEGVVWVPEQAQVFAQESGFVSELLVEPGQTVEKGSPLLQLHEFNIEADIDILSSRIAASKIEYRRTQSSDITKSQQIASDVEQLQRELQELRAQQKGLTVYAKSAGQFTLLNEKTLSGRYVEQGELLAYVVNREKLLVRAIVPQNLLGRVQQGVIQANVRLADRFSQVIPAELTQLTPSASNDLPSLSLAFDGFDGIAVASQADNQWKTLDRVFHMELALPDFSTVSGIGGKAYVSLVHQSEPLGVRWWRSARQLLLTRLNV